MNTKQKAFFVVVAGTYEGDTGERNYKYISEEFATFEEANADWKKVNSYHFADIEYTDEQGRRWILRFEAK